MIKFNRNKKYQGGGTIGGGTYSVPVTPVNVPRTQTYVAPFIDYGRLGQTPTSESSGKTSTGSKESELEFKGVTSDVKAVNQRYNQIKAELASLPAIEIETQSPRFLRLMSELQKLTGLKQELENNQTMFNTAVADSENKRNSLLTLQRGNTTFVGVRDEKGVNFIPINEYAEKVREKGNRISAITVQDAIDFRQNDIPFYDFQNKRENPLSNALVNAISTTSDLSDVISTLEKSLANMGEEKGSLTTKGIELTSNTFKTSGLEGVKKAWSNNSKAYESVKNLWILLPEEQRAQLRLRAITDLGAKTPQEIEKNAFILMTSYLSKSKSSMYDNVYEQEEFDSGSGSGGGKSGAPVGSYVTAKTFANAKEINFTWGEENMQLTGAPIGNWKRNSESNFISTNETFSAAADIPNAYTITGERIREVEGKGGFLSTYGKVKPGTKPSYVKIPIDASGKPLLSKTNIAKINEFNKLIKDDPTNPVVLQKAAEKTGLTGVRFNDFIVASMIGVSDKTLSKDKGFNESSSQTARMLREEVKNSGRNTEPFIISSFGGGDNVYEYIAIFPERDNLGAATADNMILSSQSKKVANEINLTENQDGNPASVLNQNIFPGLVDDLE